MVEQNSRPRLNTVERHDRFITNLTNVAQKREAQALAAVAIMTDEEKLALQEKKRHETQKRQSLLQDAGKFAQKKKSLLVQTSSRKSMKPSSQAPRRRSQTTNDLKANIETLIDEEVEGDDEDLPSQNVFETPSSVNLRDVQSTPEGEAVIMQGPVMQERARGTKSLSKGFRKLVWKHVWLQLRTDTITLYKNDTRAQTHSIIGIQDIVDAQVAEDITPKESNAEPSSPPAFGFNVAFVFNQSEQLFHLRTGDRQTAEAWVQAILHNKQMITQVKAKEAKVKRRSITISNVPDAGRNMFADAMGN